MANITNLLNQIKTAVKGEDVRGAIHDAIEQCYTDGQWDVQVGSSGHGLVDKLARDRIDQYMTHGTGQINETTLFPRESDPEGMTIYCETPFNLKYDPALYDVIRVYYKVVRTGDAQIYEFKASDFAQNPSVISGGYFQRQASPSRFVYRRINIKHVDGSDDPTAYIAYDVSTWQWSGAANDTGVSAPADGTNILDGEFPAGQIVLITGVKYAGVTDALNDIVGSKTALTTEDTSTLVAAINEINTKASTSKVSVSEGTDHTTITLENNGSSEYFVLPNDGAIGHMSGLETDSKTTLVAAINEVNNKASDNQVEVIEGLNATSISVTNNGLTSTYSVPNIGTTGNLSSLETETKTNLVRAINEVNSKIDSSASEDIGKVPERLKTILENMMTLFSAVSLYNDDVDVASIGAETSELINGLEVIVPEMTRLDAVFNQTEVIYSDATLNTLKQYLTVRAYYTDGSFKTISDYTINGTIATGVQTFTVTFNEFSDTFQATITKVENNLIYTMPTATVFDGTNYIDTGIKLYENETDTMSWTICAAFRFDTDSTSKYVFGAKSVSGTKGTVNVVLGTGTTATGSRKLVQQYNGATAYIGTFNPTTGEHDYRVCVTHAAGENNAKFSLAYDGTVKLTNNTVSGAFQYRKDSVTLCVGYDNAESTKKFVGTVSEFKVYSNVLDSESITEFLGGNN